MYIISKKILPFFVIYKTCRFRADWFKNDTSIACKWRIRVGRFSVQVSCRINAYRVNDLPDWKHA